MRPVRALKIQGLKVRNVIEHQCGGSSGTFRYFMCSVIFTLEDEGWVGK